MNGGCTVTVSKEGSQTADTVIEANITKMWSRLHVNSRPNAVWLCNQDVEPQLDILSTTLKNVAGSENVGGSFNPLYDRNTQKLKGRPVLFVEQAATIGDLGDIILADLKGMVSGVRGGVDSQVSMHLRFDYAESAFRFIVEADSKPWLQSAITPFKGSNTLSTFVILQAR
jgi:HK97 family phage major capsid protein